MIKTALAGLVLPVALISASWAQERTEIFHLRTECGELARKLYDRDRQFASAVMLVSYQNRYSVKLNRCFYKVTVFWTADNYAITTLYDAQEPGAPMAAADTRTGSVPGWISFLPEGKYVRRVSYEEASRYIEAMMVDEGE